MAERSGISPDPEDFYRILTEVESSARRSDIVPESRQKILHAADEIRRKAGRAEDEALFNWDRSIRDCLNQIESQGSDPKSIAELLDGSDEAVGKLLNCLQQIKEEMHR